MVCEIQLNAFFKQNFLIFNISIVKIYYFVTVNGICFRLWLTQIKQSEEATFGLFMMSK